MKKALTLLLALAMLLALAACGGGNTAPAGGDPPAASAGSTEEPIVLTFAAHFSNTIPLGQDVETAKAILEEKSGGTMTLDMFFNESLLKQTDTFVSLGQGVADIAYVPSQNMSDVKMSGIFKILFPQGAVNDVLAMTDIYRSAVENTDFQENLAQFNLHCLDVNSLGGKVLCTSKKQVHTPDDLKGMNIGANGNDANFFTAVGAGAVALANADYYSGMSNGLVDGLANHYASVYNYNLYEVTKYITEFGGGIECSATAFLMNLDKWNSLTEQQQSWVTETFKEVGDLTAVHHAEDITNYRQFCIDNGIEVYTLTEDEQAVFAPYMEEVNQTWIKEASTDGWDAQGAYDYIVSEIAKIG